MLRIDNIKTEPDATEAEVRARAAALLRVHENEFTDFRVLRRSIDARREVCAVWSVTAALKNETAAIRRSRNVSRYIPAVYTPPPRITAPAPRPVIVGAGPAGLFCTLLLARCGARPILLERGKRVEERVRDVERFWQTGALNPASNVQFGEGGAGAFSDGKLNTGTRDPRHGWILERFVAYGASPDILVDAKPHVGTDRLRVVLKNLREELLCLGAELRFEHRLDGIDTDGAAVRAVHISAPEGAYDLPARQVVLAVGHSARDTFSMLHALGVPMEPKPFAVGVRIEHRQRAIDAALYREAAGNPALPPASYKLAYHTRDGRGVFSFCVCPGGQVVAAASEVGGVVTNGMSMFARDGDQINGGLLVSVTPDDFGAANALAGVAFQRRLEDAAYHAGGGTYAAPAQTVGDFLARRASTGAQGVSPSYRPAVQWGNLWDCLPSFVCDALAEALPELDKRLPGFAAPDAVLTAVESRSSSPVRILRGMDGQSALRGLYPCGEGAGYAGGIMSAAADGMRAAEMVLRA